MLKLLLFVLFFFSSLLIQFFFLLAIVVAFSYIDIVVKSFKVFLFSSLSHFHSVLLSFVSFLFFFYLFFFVTIFIEIKWPCVKKFPVVLFSFFFALRVPLCVHNCVKYFFLGIPFGILMYASKLFVKFDLS